MLMHCIDASFLLTNLFSLCYAVQKRVVVVKVRRQKTIILNLSWCTNCKYYANEMLSAILFVRNDHCYSVLQICAHWFVFTCASKMTPPLRLTNTVSGQDFYQVSYVADELRVKQTYSKRDKRSGRFLVNADTTPKTSKQTINLFDLLPTFSFQKPWL